MTEGERQFLRELSGQLAISLYGSDAATNLDSLRTDANQILWSRNFREPILQNGTLLQLAISSIYTCPANTVAEEVWVEVTSNDNTIRTVDLFVDPFGALVTTQEMILDTYSLAANAIPVRLGPYSLAAGGTIRGLCSNANSVTARVFGWTRPTPP